MTVGDQCPTCSHYRGLLKCDAFPDGIPFEILSGRADHADPYPGDGGIRYKAFAPENCTTFTVAGSVRGRPGRVTWTGGRVTGDDHALAAVATVVALDGPFAATPTGPMVPPALGPAWVAFLTILRAFDRRPDPVVTGDEVDMSALDVSPGAIP